MIDFDEGCDPPDGIQCDDSCEPIATNPPGDSQQPRPDSAALPDRTPRNSGSSAPDERQIGEMVAADKWFDGLALEPELEAHVKAMFRFGPDAQRGYDDTLSPLIDDADTAAASLQASYGNAAIDSYKRRWATVYILGALQVASALPFLETIARRPQGLDPVAVGVPESLSPLEQELMIRNAAIRGIERLFLGGAGGARDALLRIVNDPNLDPRARSFAVIALRANGVSVDEIRLPAGLTWAGELELITSPDQLPLNEQQ